MPTANHTPTAFFNANACSCCCVNMGCGTPKVWPDELDFVASVAGSCPEASNVTVSGTMSAGVQPTCEELTSGVCMVCGCSYTWEIDPADIPLCGPYISSVSLVCGVAVEDALFGPITGCPHLRREKCHWYALIVIERADVFRIGPPPCPFDPDTGLVTHAVQSCVDCTWSCLPGAGDPECCATCPPCYECHGCDPARGDECCGDGGCEPCVLPYCFNNACDRCWLPFTGVPNDPSCFQYCSGGGTRTRRYTLYLRSCADPDEIRGCNPTSCPPDDKNTGDFFIHLECSEDEFFEASCPL